MAPGVERAPAFWPAGLLRSVLFPSQLVLGSALSSLGTGPKCIASNKSSGTTKCKQEHWNATLLIMHTCQEENTERHTMKYPTWRTSSFLEQWSRRHRSTEGGRGHAAYSTKGFPLIPSLSSRLAEMPSSKLWFSLQTAAFLRVHSTSVFHTFLHWTGFHQALTLCQMSENPETSKNTMV